ncbi:hypothetical protein VTL71DRAFT_1604 [Oculimacula yallundae]|uniref:Uncharacterized protein n=1 Tax=Oculimacula yallundae TaxID=86028 RepID=A0ABR4CBM7_9HELO
MPPCQRCQGQWRVLEGGSETSSIRNHSGVVESFLTAIGRELAWGQNRIASEDEGELANGTLARRNAMPLANDDMVLMKQFTRIITFAYFKTSKLLMYPITDVHQVTGKSSC